ncbi:Arc family DNA-binding protein [Pseudomonas sp. P7759]|uniref:Arc family DNA-binding protein n=1 Tax=Pseudomonas sp. P7759 TaxID=2738831 RepID=UPI0015A49053|nr:Arc family DNA-binding protein [Pseudomonas sp. P7759]NWC74256.1 Arc family DNA-binding protein [Pseudomonas sp. P7759]
MNSNYPSRTADKFVVRLPDGLRDSIPGAADYLDTSMNTVFVQAVRQYLDSQKRQQLLLDALAHYRPASPVVEGLQRDLTQRDERIDQLEVLLHRWADLLGVSAPDLRDETLAALKPTESGTGEHICPGCGTKGWTANCDQCVPY